MRISLNLFTQIFCKFVEINILNDFKCIEGKCRRRRKTEQSAGQMQRQVAHDLGVSHIDVQQLLEKFLQTSPVIRRPQSGCPMSTSHHEDRQIAVLARRRRFESAVVLNRGFENASGVRIQAKKTSE